MMTGRIEDDLHICIEYSEGFREFIADGKMPGNLARVKVGDEFIIGGKDYYTESAIMGITLVEALEALLQLADDETAVIGFTDGGGTILIIEPHDQQTVTLTPAVSNRAVSNPDERIFDSVIVTKDAVVSEILRVAKEWRDKALNINTDISQIGWFENLEQAIINAESEYK